MSFVTLVIMARKINLPKDNIFKIILSNYQVINYGVSYDVLYDVNFMFHFEKTPI